MNNLYESLCERMNGQLYSHYFMADCPFDSHKKLALMVFEDGYYRCLSCSAHGTHAYLDRKLGSHFRPVQRSEAGSNILPAWKSWERKWGDLHGIADAAHENLLRYPQYQSYYKKRKVNEYIQQGYLGYLDGWCVIPVFDRAERIVDTVVRASRGKGDTRYVVKPVSSAAGGFDRPIYCPNWQRLEESETAYVVYGIFDAMALELISFPVITGITGKSINAELLKPLGKRLIILPDLGEEREAHNLANQLGWRAKVKELLFPESVKDPAGVREMYGNDALRELICIHI